VNGQVFDRERNDAVRPSMRSAICWSAVLTMCAAGTVRAQDVPPAPAPPQDVGPATSPAQPATSPAQPVTPATGPGQAVAPATGPERWTVESANTVGAGANVFAAAVGYPGLDLRLIHGLDSTTDVNARVGFNYAFEGLTQGTRFEFTAQVGIRKELVPVGSHMKLSGRFDPGIIIAASPGQFGLKIPFGLELGIPLNQQLILNASIDLPLFFTFGDVNAFYIPLLFGVGGEYLLQSNLAVTAKLKLGPTWGTGDASGSAFTLYALVGAAYKF
jgi:hypothetical protein